jgi:hypothetical protein
MPADVNGNLAFRQTALPGVGGGPVYDNLGANAVSEPYKQRVPEFRVGPSDVPGGSVHENAGMTIVSRPVINRWT